MRDLRAPARERELLAVPRDRATANSPSRTKERQTPVIRRNPNLKQMLKQNRDEYEQEVNMPRGEKSKYTDKQERKADHIAEGYKERGVSSKEAERRAWATVNKDDGGGKKPGGSGRGKETGNPAAKKGGRLGGRAAASRPAAARSQSAKKAAATRKRRAS